MKIDYCYQGDCRESMRKMLADGMAGKIQCIVTSPPYWGLRDYGCDGQIGLEESLPEFLSKLVEVFDLCCQLLADDGTCWVNMGDSYAARSISTESFRRDRAKVAPGKIAIPNGIKPKDLMGQPWRLAFALQDAGWYLRQDIIWHKPNPMPESIRDRCTKSHEYLFLLTKSERYYYDFDAMQEPVTGGAHGRGSGVNPKASTPAGWDTSTGSHDKKTGRYSNNGVGFGHGYDSVVKPRAKQNASFSAAVKDLVSTRNRRSVWTIPTQSFSEAHFATFPEALVEPCIIAGSRPGDIVFDPFLGSGTTAQVAQRLGRKWVGCELNPEYIKLQDARTRQLGMQLEVA